MADASLEHLGKLKALQLVASQGNGRRSPIRWAARKLLALSQFSTVGIAPISLSANGDPGEREDQEATWRSNKNRSQCELFLRFHQRYG